jgi:catechol 2,3-dioxygenase-like lactoylglutathione lyase family enzyme
MLHHISFAVTDLARSGAFYDAVLIPLGYVRVWTRQTAIGYGLPGGGDNFAIKLQTVGVSIPGEGFHAAFAAPSHESIAAFYRAALANGGKDNGGSGFHAEYGSHYYAAFVFDPDGYRIEAVIHDAV